MIRTGASGATSEFRNRTGVGKTLPHADPGYSGAGAGADLRGARSGG
jgi:hypothetical protein